MKLQILIFAILLSLLACQSEKPAPSNSINGIWQSIGSGLYLEISDSTQYAFYDATTISCLPSRKGKFSEIENELSLQNDTLSLLIGPITYYYTMFF